MRALLPGCLLVALAACGPKVDPAALAAPPEQQLVSDPWFDVTRGDLLLRVKPRARYAVRGLVLDDSRWLLDRWEDVSPLDLTIGWGVAVRPDVQGDLDLVTENRFATWSCDVDGVSKRDLELSIGNHHLIPATPEVEDALDDVGKGDVVRLEGLLVDVDVRAHDEVVRRYTTSLDRGDTGAKACELMWVESVRVGRAALEAP